MTFVSIARSNELAVITIANPPVNALSVAVRSQIFQALHDIEADMSLKGVVLTGSERNFIAGADIRELDLAQQSPTLADITLAIENSRLPWVAAIAGAALGGGLEVAMACHGRVAASDSKLGLPEVSLGIIAGAGGVVRLPRLVPVHVAVGMCSTGKPISAAEALAWGLVDEVVSDDVVSAAKAHAERLAAHRDLPRVLQRPLREPPSEQEFEKLREEIARKARGQDAPLEAFEALRDSVRLPATEALALSRARFLRLVTSKQSKALRHVFFAERAAGAALRNVTSHARSLAHVGLGGGGTMGAGIAAAFIIAGSRVTLVERTAEAADTARAKIEAILAEGERRGTVADRAAAAGKLVLAQNYASLAECPLVIEAVFEDMAVKADVFRQLDAVMPTEAILATNTSYLDVDELARVTRDPGRVLGLHFFSPAYAMKLLEVVKGRATSEMALATAGALARHLRKVPIVAGVCDGFIANRIMSAYRREGEYLLEEGAMPEEIDAAMLNFGFPMGLYEVQDLAGLDIAWAMRKRRAALRPHAERYSQIADLLCEAGRFGRKVGRGWYAYQDGKAVPDPEVTALILSESDRLGTTRRSFTADEITARILAVMQAEARQVLSEGIAESAGDIDVAMILGFGFPRHRGGPMFLAGNA